MSNKLKLKLKYILLFILIIICTYAMNLANSRYLSSKKINNSNVEIANPIVEIEPVSESTLSDIMPGDTVVYDFNIKNANETLTNDILMDYYIKLTWENENLPITYSIYDVTSGEENPLTINSETNQTAVKQIGYNELETHKYRIKFTWPEANNDVSYANKQTSFNIELYAEQASA